MRSRWFDSIARSVPDHIVGSTLNPGGYGTVTFTGGAVVIATKTINGGVATVSVSSLSVGNHAIAAVYGG